MLTISAVKDDGLVKRPDVGADGTVEAPSVDIEDAGNDPGVLIGKDDAEEEVPAGTMVEVEADAVSIGGWRRSGSGGGGS
jgi:hypothetical protein